MNELEQPQSSSQIGMAGEKTSIGSVGRPQSWQIRRRIAALFTHPSLGSVEGSTGYFYGVDFLRGIAALSIIFWHYNHFLVAGQTVDRFPLYGALWLLYEHGGNAVQLFWLISGFTFSSVYTKRHSTSREFAVHRFARLYPLHILTLFIVAVLQVLSLLLVKHFLIYQNNDLIHLADQVLLTPGWGATIRFSFNGPIWTVSVEILIYAVFWLVLPVLFRWGLLIPAVIAVVSLILSRLGPAAHIFQGGFFFFSGCVLLPIFLAFQSARSLMAALAVLNLALAVLVLAVFHSIGIGSTLLCFTALLGASQIQVKNSGSRAASIMKWMGDNTYGTYLWHVPVQIAILLVASYFGIPESLFLRPTFLIIFLAVVVGMSRLSFVYYERPCRTYINRRLAPADKGLRSRPI